MNPRTKATNYPQKFVYFIFAITLTIYCFSVNASQKIADESKGRYFNLGDKVIPYKTETLASALNFPWSVAFLPDGKILISEKSGQLKLLAQGKVSEPLTGLPDVFFKSQGGLFDVILDPDFNNNQFIYFSYASGNMAANATHVASAKLADNQLTLVKTIFKVTPEKNTPVHYGGKLLMMPDGTILLTTGDGFDYREKAQHPKGLLGKIVRFNRDGSIPTNNPFYNSKEYHPAIYSLGHRNPQGIDYDYQNKQVIMHEHGPAGGDEINIIRPGKNYGWPIVTYGKDYSGATVSPFTSYKGLEEPLLHWTPSIAPSGLAIYKGELFSEIEGSYLVGALAGRELRLVVMQQQKVIEQLSLLKEESARIRDVRVGPDGAIYVLTDGEKGQLIRITRN